jgi:NCS1 family nucleobase:cation symporter-1
MTVRPRESAAVYTPDFVTTSEDLSASPLWNHDLAPTPIERRTWSTYNIAALWIGMSVVITTYTLASGLMSQGMNWWQAMVTILLGNVIVLIPMVLNAHAGTRYGISFPVLCRAPFGVKGANVAAMLRAIVACGWFGIQTWIGALALDTLFGAAWSGWSQLALGKPIAFAIFWLIQVAIILKGTEGIKVLESWSAPLLLAGGLLLLVWGIRNGGGLGHVLSESQKAQDGPDALLVAVSRRAHGKRRLLGDAQPQHPRFHALRKEPAIAGARPGARLADDDDGVRVHRRRGHERDDRHFRPADLGSSGSGQQDRQRRSDHFCGHRRPRRAVDDEHGGERRLAVERFLESGSEANQLCHGRIDHAVIGIAMMPWKLYSDAAAYIFTWLLGYSSLMGALGGILISDYWVVRRQQLSLPDLFREQGAYTYRGGVNPAAMIALVLGVLPVIPGFIHAVRLPAARSRIPVCST